MLYNSPAIRRRRRRRLTGLAQRRKTTPNSPGRRAAPTGDPAGDQCETLLMAPDAPIRTLSPLASLASVAGQRL
jgi:hypothetical protein